MKVYTAKEIRNLAVVGHGGDGKTTLTEAFLFNAGAIDRMGKVEDGSTTTDYDPEEIKRQISISMALAPLEYKGCKLNIIDTPGYFDFAGEMVEALHFADGALILVSAVSGLSVGAEKAYEMCDQRNLPRMILVNQMDRENADFNKTLNQLTDRYGTRIVALQLPIMEGGSLAGFVDLIEMKAKLFDGTNLKDAEIPSALSGDVEALRETLIEAAAENDDDLLEKFFGGEELSKEEIIAGVRAGVMLGKIAPVLAGAAAPNLGIGALMEGIIEYMPSPADLPPVACKDAKTDEETTQAYDDTLPFSAQVIKTVADPFVGKLSLFKVYSGVLKSDSSLYNMRVSKSEKPGTIYNMRGKKQTTVTEIHAGDIGALAKLQHTLTGDTLCESNQGVVFPALEFPKPCISLAVTAKKEGEEDKVFAGLYRLMDEDPTMIVEKDSVTSDTLIRGMGELHLEVICRKLQNKFDVEAQLNEPKIPYRETIRKTVKAEGKHKKQTGGAGQFGHVFIQFEPILDSNVEFEFVDKIVGGVVPRQFIPAVEKGLRESVKKGVLAGYPMVNLRCTLYDGKYHPVDSKEIAFISAARLAYRKGCAEANPILLEPIYKVEVNIPDEYMGDVIGDLNRRRGRILGMNPVMSGQQVSAEVPLAEMFKYATDLRSMTQARGVFDMEFLRYEEVPANIAAKVVEQGKKDMDDAE
ncbi:MAG: elongation factor G [Christensenellales bacterium]|jgi:elongation factor G